MLEDPDYQQQVSALFGVLWNSEQTNEDILGSDIAGRISENILAAGKKNNSSRLSRPNNWWWAAASIVIIFTTVWLSKTKMAEKPYISASVTKVSSPILPGGNKAILTLGDGREIDLTKAANGIIDSKSDVAIVKGKDGRLTYSVKTQDNKTTPTEISFNTITTPKGGQYEIVLPDQTTVFLNAASSLTYPVTFAGNERRVQLKGEAYFEVSPNKQMPFLVDVGSTNIKVLGTHFNVMAYQDEALSRTTLLEGSIALTVQGRHALLSPGQQAIVGQEGQSIEIKQINADDAIAWKMGYFKFTRENIPAIMRKIARWYDVEVVYEADCSNIIYGGTISRGKNIQELLHKIELSGSVQFKIKGRRVIVSL